MILRVARHTNQLAAIEAFYTKALNLEVLGRFEGHTGYDGLFLGRTGLDWHLEFTVSPHQAEHQPDEDDLLVLYPTTQAEHDALLASIEAAGIARQQPRNPYWEAHDDEGYA